MSSKRLQILLLVAASTAALAAQPAAKHPLTLDDMARIRSVRDPQCSPDGRSIAYVVSTIDVKEDKSNAHIWMVGLDGKSDRQVTVEPGQRVVSALEPRRKVSRLHLVAARAGEGQPGVAARSERRRSGAADRRQGPAAGLRVVARLEAPGARRRRSGSRRGAAGIWQRRGRPPARSPRRRSRSSSIATSTSRTARAICSRAATATSISSTSPRRSSIG